MALLMLCVLQLKMVIDSLTFTTCLLLSSSIVDAFFHTLKKIRKRRASFFAENNETVQLGCHKPDCLRVLKTILKKLPAKAAGLSQVALARRNTSQSRKTWVNRLQILEF